MSAVSFVVLCLSTLLTQVFEGSSTKSVVYIKIMAITARPKFVRKLPDEKLIIRVGTKSIDECARRMDIKSVLRKPPLRVALALVSVTLGEDVAELLNCNRCGGTSSGWRR